MDYAALRAEILGGPHAVECAPHVVNFDAPKTPGAYLKDQAIADILNAAPGGKVYRSRFITARAMLAELDPVDAAALLDKLEALAGAHSAVKWAMRYITTDGIDIGHPSTIAMLQFLIGPGGLTQDEVATLTDMAAEDVGRGALLFGAPVTAADVSIALRGGADYNPWE